MAYYNVSSGSKKPVQIMRQGKPISTSNLNVRFNQLLKDPLSVSQGEQSFRKRTALGVSTDTVFDTFFSPFRTRQTVETPAKRQDLNQWNRKYYKDAWVGTAIDLHTEFPMSGFDVRHEDVQLEEFFNKVKDDTSLESFVMNMVSEYFIVGEAIPLG